MEIEESFLMPTSPYLFRLPLIEKESLIAEAAARGLSLNAYLFRIVRARARIDVLGGEVLGARSARAVILFREAFGEDLLALYRLRNGKPEHWRGVAILSDSCTMTTRRKNKVLHAFGQAEAGNWAAARFVSEGNRVYRDGPHPWTELVRVGYPVFIKNEEPLAAFESVIRSAFDEKRAGPPAIASGPVCRTKYFGD